MALDLLVYGIYLGGFAILHVLALIELFGE